MDGLTSFFADPLYLGLAGILMFDGALIAFFTWAIRPEALGRFRIRTPKTYALPKARKLILISTNMNLSLVALFGGVYLFRDHLITPAAGPWQQIFGEILACLLLYDLSYYFFHKGMHLPKIMRFMHGVHHTARFPTATESLYSHPLENMAGLGLLLLTIAVVGPITVTGFLITFWIYSTVNILVHVNLRFPVASLRLINFWAHKHDLHHGRHMDRNYASIFPFWDQLFGTSA